ncbi:MAG: bifunctional adenosylcobinamide kinase/adenosylcobinamide-phosphate guanylyltransferase [Candidatus Omnitrophica bacterium]|nr:bifunctional adenosylcobinamide kinase/adenosylcobinamide-phosphate guanylyltransferase [Candidatus Omnitrophota bacterium]
MAKITFIIGGARSGKSSFALKLARRYKQVAFIATCEPLDNEMRQRIRLHQKQRPRVWQTFQEYKDLTIALKKISNKTDCIIIDCLTLLVSNLLLKGATQSMIEQKIKKIITFLSDFKGRVIIVSNEVGMGIVPVSKLGRDFRDINGIINQIVAGKSQEVFFMIAGIAQKIK